ncbi:Threonine/homoserine/homoserine lactone efflux protein [Halomonas sp. HL-93]|nr:MAG: putative threonine efflux protein [Halomonas sp. HL-93]SBR50784.1 Threonine/homoserine/homoserine lactone efflux protein [Halomonas sp. HL-93]
MHYLTQSIAIGFMIAAPVGPIGLLCMQRTLADGWKLGFITGLGAASADLLYGILGALGFAAIISLLSTSLLWLSIAGGVILIYLGVSAAKNKTNHSAKNKNPHSPLKAYLTTFFLTLSNPMTIFAFIAIFSAIVPNGNSPTDIGLVKLSIICLGVFLGSMAWWVFLTSAVYFLAAKINESKIKTVSCLAGVSIALFGCHTVVTTIIKVL